MAAGDSGSQILPKFSYTPFSDPSRSIRLFQILASPEDEPLQLDLRPELLFDQNDYPSYVALSYTWGPPEPQKLIQVQKKNFSIRENLWLLLKRLKRSGESRLIWTDAICIDQKNNDEKSFQVSMMDEIYRLAQEVIVWLGIEADQSDMVIAAANGHHQAGSSASRAGQGLLSTEPLDLDLLGPLSALCTRPYWQRTWILQEIALARGEISVLCGSARTTFQQFKAILELYHNHLILQGPPLPGPRSSEDEQNVTYWDLLSNCTVLELRNDDAIAQHSLNQLINLHGNSVCFDPRDKVYALQSMAPKKDRLPVSYSIDVAELYWHVIKRCKSSDPRFGRTLQNVLGLSISDLRNYADLIDLSAMPEPTKYNDESFHDLEDTWLRKIGTISAVQPITDESRSNFSTAAGHELHFTVTSTLQEGSDYKLGWSNIQPEKNDTLWIVNHIFDLALIVREPKVSPPLPEADINSINSSADQPQQHQFLGFSLLRRSSDCPDFLSTLLQTFSRMDLFAKDLQWRQFQHDEYSQYTPLESERMLLILNPAAILSFLEYEEFAEQSKVNESQFRHLTHWQA